jgi:DNA modification methylase
MANRVLSDIFTVPPISVLDIKQKYWKDRKKEWLGLGLQSELGRTGNLLGLSELMASKHNATSIFDPVLCECAYSWFTKQNDIILDPFAGGSVRGIVAAKLNRKYIGFDIRKEQVESNYTQSNNILKESEFLPTWINSSSIEISKHGLKTDFIFTCPPYYDLEKYSKLPEDLSNMDMTEFDATYENIMRQSVNTLNENRFGMIVVGNVRDNSGCYMDLVGKTVKYIEDAGGRYYNEMILLQEPASAAMRSFNFMNSSRKIAKCHQNVIVFVKGDPLLATKRMCKFTNVKKEEDGLDSFFD